MPVSNQQNVIRQYLLGQLTEDEQASAEQRLVSDDDFLEEFELVKDELVEEYLAGELTREEKQWFEENFLASPEGKKRQRFATTLNRYVIENRPITTSKTGWTDRLGGFWTSQPFLARAVGAVFVLAIVGGIFWYQRVPPTRTVAALTVIATQPTRSGENGSKKIQLKSDVLLLTMMLPASSASGGRYRAELRNSQGASRVFEANAKDDQSVTVEIPAANLPPGQQVVNLSKIGTDGTVERIPGGFYFTVE